MIEHQEDCKCRICQTLRKSIQLGWVERRENGEYHLTPKGEDIAAFELERSGK